MTKGVSTKFQDDVSDSIYYGYRYYNASRGRWLSRDPSEEFGGENLSCFLNNNPLCQLDPLGLAGTNDPNQKSLCTCTCVSVEVTFEPKDPPNKFKWGITYWKDKQGNDTQPKLGNNIHVTFKTKGDRSLCEFHQDETGMQNSAGYDQEDPDKIHPTSETGTDHVISPDKDMNSEGSYVDRLGVPLQKVGFYYMGIAGKIVFRCKGLDGSTASKTWDVDAWAIAAARSSHKSSVLRQQVVKSVLE